MYFIVPTVIFISVINTVTPSAGDNSYYYNYCVEKCRVSDCSEDGIHFLNGNKQPFYESFMRWSCEDDCKYHCMWETVTAFHKRDLKTPQFHGKWPFIRFLGMQEPASAIFSVFNLFANVRSIYKFTKQVRPDSPLYKLWYAYCYVSMHTWMWSTIFHCKDTPLTEYMDYVCAFLMVFMFCYCMTIRLLRKLPRVFLVVVTTFFTAFFLTHASYLYGKFDYSYNMLVNIIIGTLTAVIWFLWCLWNRKRQPYVYKCALFVTLSGLVTLLEIIDVPPVLWILDCHALWHLITAPLICIFYSFVIDDCKYLRKIEMETLEQAKPVKKDY